MLLFNLKLKKFSYVEFMRIKGEANVCRTTDVMLFSWKVRTEKGQSTSVRNTHCWEGGKKFGINENKVWELDSHRIKKTPIKKIINNVKFNILFIQILLINVLLFKF